MSKNLDNDFMEHITAALNKLETKVDGINVKITDIDKTLLRNTISLEEHMKRSDQLEHYHNHLKTSVRPVLTAYTVAWGISKIVVGISVLVGLLKLLGLF